MDIIEDNPFFRKIGLIKSFELTLNWTSGQFRSNFERHVGPGQTSVGIQRPKHEFQGSVRQTSFKVYRSMSMGDSSLAAAQGTYKDDENVLKLDVNVYIPMTTFIMYSFGILAIFGLSCWTMISRMADGKMPSIAWPFMMLGVMATFVGTMWYLGMRNNIKKLTFDLEREIVYWTKDANALQQSM